jgi:outer membrane protein
MEQENNMQINDLDIKQPVIEQEEKKSRSCPLRPSTFINVFFFVAIAVLYFLHFYSKNGVSEKSASTGNLKIAFFNTDSVFQNYLLVDVLREELKAEKGKLEGTFTSKQAAFDQKVKNYQINMQNNSVNAVQAQNAERQLMKEREEIMAMNEQFTQQLAAKEMEINRVITEAIVSYSQKFNEKYGADYILGYTKGGPIIVTNAKMDVTKEILEGLNKEYKEKPTK